MIHYMYHVLSCVDMIKAKRQQICLEFHYRLILSLFISCSVSVTLAKRKHSWVFLNLHVQNGSSVNSKEKKMFFLWIRCTLIAVKYDAQNYFTARKRSCRKVMLLHPGHTPPWADTTPPGQSPPSRDGNWSWRYASYWNAFLLFNWPGTMSISRCPVGKRWNTKF